MQLTTSVKMALCAGILALSTTPATAQEAALITLKSLDGKVVMIGELQGFEAGHYNIIVSGLGLLRIEEALVTCQSETIDCAALVSNS
jgi:hypothetical protein